MKIKNLIKILSTYDQELDVCVNGFEGGLCDVKKDQIGIVGINRNVNPKNNWWDGPHGVDMESADKVLLISR